MNTIKTQAIITTITSKTDGSLGLRVATPELRAEEKALFFELQGANLELTITPIDQVVAPEYRVDKEIEQKHPSARLRAVFWRIWEAEGQQGEFDTYYRIQMEKIIEHFKNKLS